MTDYSTHIRSLDLDESIKEAAIANLDTWLEGAEFADYRPQLEDLIAREQWIVLVDSFYQEIPFGGLQETVVTGPSPADAAGQHHGAAPIEHRTLVPVGEWSQWILASSQGNLVGAVGSRATEVPGDHQVIKPLPLDHVRCFDIGGVPTG